MKITIVVGARPNFMKVAPILRAFQARQGSHPPFSVTLVHTGQHYDPKMSGDFFRDLDIPAPGVNLGVGGGTHARQTAAVMMRFEEFCLDRKPDWVIVVGDVNSTLACALTARKLGIRVAHVEAGLRSYDRNMPEEINRLCTDTISDLLFTTDSIASGNLLREGVPTDRIHFVGNTMIDTLLRHVGPARLLPLPGGLSSGQFGILTLHRPSNVDSRENLASILGAIASAAERIPIIFPAHPRTAGNIESFGLSAWLNRQPNIRMIEPLSYLPFLGLVANSRLVLTDSGGIQEETTVLGIPCLTMRSNTERPITCEIGTNVLVGNDPERIRGAALAVLDGKVQGGSIPEKWDGRAAERLAGIILNQVN